MASGFRPDGYYHIEIGRPDPVGPGGTGGSGGSGGGNGQPGQQMVIYKGQMGYWTENTSGGKNDYTTRVFHPVGPSEAEKAATTEKALQEKLQAEAAAKNFAVKTAATAAAAEKNR